jgi:hypothetical protein
MITLDLPRTEGFLCYRTFSARFREFPSQTGWWVLVLNSSNEESENLKEGGQNKAVTSWIDNLIECRDA